MGIRIFDNAPACHLIKTGQTVSYHAGDDGDLGLGLDHNYEVKTTGDQSGNTNITINGKTFALSNNTVIDHTTWINGKQLEWARYVPTSVIGPAADGKLFWDQYILGPKIDISFDSASKEIRSAAAEFNTSALCAGRKYAITGSANNNTTFTVVSITAGVCVVSETVADEDIGAWVFLATVGDLVWDFMDEANANNLGGHNDWRGPSYRELSGIVDLGEFTPTIDTVTFPATPSESCWTSSAALTGSVQKFRIDFYTGKVDYAEKNLHKHYCRLVRS